MSLITERVNVNLVSQNISYYENIGYDIPRYLDNKNRMKVKLNTMLEVSISDVPKGSDVVVEYQCDGCGLFFEISWYHYNISVQEDGKKYCHPCSIRTYGVEIARKNNLLKGISFEQRCLEIDRKDALVLWDYEKNVLGPKEIGYARHGKAYFKCPDGIHESEEKSISSITCRNLLIECSICNSLGFKYKESLDLWSKQNNKSPFEYSFMCNETVWWKCKDDKHEDYPRKVNNSVIYMFRCPECSAERKESLLQEKVRKHLENIEKDCAKKEINFKIIREYNRESLICINPKTNRQLPYDNEVVSENFNLIVEVHGFQHYDVKGWAKLSDNPEEEFEYIQWKDQYKMGYALSQGYYYLAIPYWTEKDGTWQQLIDDKLQEIYNDLN